MRTSGPAGYVWCGGVPLGFEAWPAEIPALCTMDTDANAGEIPRGFLHLPKGLPATIGYLHGRARRMNGKHLAQGHKPLTPEEIAHALETLAGYIRAKKATVETLSLAYRASIQALGALLDAAAPDPSPSPSPSPVPDPTRLSAGDCP